MSNERPSVHEIEHTADLGIEVTASDLPALFAAAGEALFALIVDPKTVEARDEIAVAATGNGAEDLLHAWLCELLAQFNVNGFVGKSCEIRELTEKGVYGRIKGEKLDLTRHGFHTEIKGVTYHDFKAWEEGGVWKARVIFDV